MSKGGGSRGIPPAGGSRGARTILELAQNASGLAQTPPRRARIAIHIPSRIDVYIPSKTDAPPASI